jgi:hypothetical protein
VRFLVLDRGAKFPLAPEHLGPMLDAFAEWRERYRGKMESFEWFLNGGGFGVVDVADERELHAMILELPFAFTDTIEVHPVIDGDTALAATREIWATKLAQAPPA